MQCSAQSLARPSITCRSPMDRITFTVNKLKCSVGSETDSDETLNDYLRNRLGLRGVKFMCREGGCGACVVAAKTAGEHTFRGVNSCLVSITSCQDWEVRTVEGIGGRREGYHPVPRALAEYGGTQCGYCSPGWTMAMYSLLESNKYDLTQYEIENSLASNTCRCTGYRSILDAFKSFASDAPKPKPYTKAIADIEDLKVCANRGRCDRECDQDHAFDKDWCFVENNNVEFSVKKIHLKDDRIWYRIKKIADIFQILGQEGKDSYMLVNGNTGRGVLPIFSFPRVLIDISTVKELKVHYLDQNLVVGAGTTLTELIQLFQSVSRQREEFIYLQKLCEHLDLVAHIPVRNIGSIAGNLMTKHRDPKFSSDIFLLLETVGATLTIVSKTSTVEVTPEQFLTLNMTGSVVTLIKLPPLCNNYRFVSFKIMPRAQNAHAQVNAGFLYKFNKSKMESTVQSARLVYGGLSAEFVHARHTEIFLIGKKLFTNETLQEALHILEKELIVEDLPGELKPEYRKKCALGLFYKGLLNLIPEEKLKPHYRSGARDFRKTRPLSKGTEVYDTNPIIWPVTEPMPKVEALIQCAGEAKYVYDVPNEPNEVFCAFVTSDICTGEIESIDPTPALKLPGVLAFFSAKDIPGRNSFIPNLKVPGFLAPEELFAEKQIKYYDQAIGVIVAETYKLANRAALLVRVKYKVDKRKPILTIEEARARDPSRVTLFMPVPAKDRGLDVRKIIKGSDNIYAQYHYCMETLTCVCKPNDEGIEVFSATQWPDIIHTAISEVLKLKQNRINVTVSRCGGAYGIKISRATHVSTACALVTYLMDRQCRFAMSIQANMRVIGKRFPCTRDFEVGVNNSGEIQYLNYDLYEDNGYVLNELVIAAAVPAVRNCYDNRRWNFNLYNVITDTSSNTFNRSPGILEAIAMTESLMEHISYTLDRDPLEVRLNNLNPEYPDVAEMVQTLVKDGEYEKRKREVENFNKSNRWKKRGLRVALMSWPAGAVVDYHVLLTVFHGDATVVVKHGGVEIGQGINTKVIQAVAFALNISLDKVKVKPTDVISNPNTLTTGGSRTTETVCFGALKCCQLLLDRLSVVRESLTNPTWEQLIQEAYMRGYNLQTSYRVTANDQQIYRSGGAAFAEVELDILTGEHEVLRVDIIEDVGTSLNPEIDLGQVEGAFVMGLGYWTHEHFIYDENTGELLTDRSWNYKVPLAKDIPIDFRVQLRRNSYNPLGTLGAKAVAEPPTTLPICVAFALRAAIAASRGDSGKDPNVWFNVDGPFTLEANVLKAEARLEEFLLY